MASPISPLYGSNSTQQTPSSSSSNGLGGPAPSEQMFLKLLVSQIQNQDPLNPTDSTTFVSQLAQFSELEQVMAMRGDLDKIVATPVSTQTDTSGTSGSNSSGQTDSTGKTQS